MTPPADQKETAKQEYVSRYTRIQEQAAEMAVREAAYDKDAEAAQRGQAIESLINSALLQSQDGAEAAKSALGVRIKDRSRHIDQRLEARTDKVRRAWPATPGISGNG